MIETQTPKPMQAFQENQAEKSRGDTLAPSKRTVHPPLWSIHVAGQV